jgi:hypothetical protein
MRFTELARVPASRAVVEFQIGLSLITTRQSAQLIACDINYFELLMTLAADGTPSRRVVTSFRIVRSDPARRARTARRRATGVVGAGELEALVGSARDVDYRDQPDTVLHPAMDPDGGGSDSTG